VPTLECGEKPKSYGNRTDFVHLQGKGLRATCDARPRDLRASALVRHSESVAEGSGHSTSGDEEMGLDYRWSCQVASGRRSTLWSLLVAASEALGVRQRAIAVLAVPMYTGASASLAAQFSVLVTPKDASEPAQAQHAGFGW
jgi:hypothetical protein